MHQLCINTFMWLFLFFCVKSLSLIAILMKHLMYLCMYVFKNYHLVFGSEIFVYLKHKQCFECNNQIDCSQYYLLKNLKHQLVFMDLFKNIQSSCAVNFMLCSPMYLKSKVQIVVTVVYFCLNAAVRSPNFGLGSFGRCA